MKRPDYKEEMLIKRYHVAKKYFREVAFIKAMCEISYLCGKNGIVFSDDSHSKLALYKTGLNYVELMFDGPRDSFCINLDHKEMWKVVKKLEEEGVLSLANWLKAAVKEQCPEIEEELGCEIP